MPDEHEDSPESDEPELQEPDSDEPDGGLPPSWRQGIALVKAREAGRREAEVEAQREPHIRTAVDVLRHTGARGDFLESREGRVAQEAHNLAHWLCDCTEWLCDPNLPSDIRAKTEERVLAVLRSQREPVDLFVEEFKKQCADHARYVGSPCPQFLADWRCWRNINQAKTATTDKASENEGPLLACSFNGLPHPEDALCTRGGRVCEAIDGQCLPVDRGARLFGRMLTFHAESVVHWVERFSPEDIGKITVADMAKAIEAYTAHDSDKAGRGKAGSKHHILAKAIEKASFQKNEDWFKDKFRSPRSRRKDQG